MAAPQFDAVSSTGATASTLSWSHTVTGIDPILIVATAIDANNSVSSITYGGVSLAQIPSASAGTGPNVEMWYLVNPATGAGTVAVTFSASDNAVGIATSYTGVDRNTPFGTTVTNTGTGTTSTGTVVAAVGDLVIDASCANNIAQDGLTVGAGQTSRNQLNQGGAGGLSLGVSEEAGAASVSMTWTWTGSQNWVVVSVPLRPVQTNKTYIPAYRILNVYQDAKRVINVYNPARMGFSRPFVTASGTSLILNGKAFRFMGVNRYNLLTPSDGSPAGCGSAWTTAQLDTWFSEIDAFNVKVVRFWAFQQHTYSGATADWAQLDYVISLARQNDMYLIPTLENQWTDCTQGGYKYDTWYSTDYLAAYGTYSLSYDTYVTNIVTRYKDEPRILMWQMMNEAECKNTSNVDQPTTLNTFATDVSAIIKGIDTNHLVNLGTMGGGQPGTGTPYYANLHNIANINVAEYHDYDWDGAAETLPSDLSLRLGQITKPLFVGEAGIRLGATPSYTQNSRNTLFDSKIDSAFDNGVAGYIIWDYRDTSLAVLPTFEFDNSDPLATTIAKYGWQLRI